MSKAGVLSYYWNVAFQDLTPITLYVDGTSEASRTTPFYSESYRKTHRGGKERKKQGLTPFQKGNNGVGNGEDGQPPGNPPVNDGSRKGNPDNKKGGKQHEALAYGG